MGRRPDRVRDTAGVRGGGWCPWPAQIGLVRPTRGFIEVGVMICKSLLYRSESIGTEC